MPKVLVTTVLLVLAGAAMAQTKPATQGEEPPPVGDAKAMWRDTSKTPDERARDLLARLTLEEKVALVHADGTFSTPGLPRFGIGKLWTSDGPQGVREEIQPQGWNAAGWTDDFSTAMPADIGLAATFDPELARAFGDVIGEEAVARKKNIMLCPGLNIMRTPLNGRNSEYFGEDPYLASRMAVGFITALQAHGVAACAKHFALNNQETYRNSANVHVDERTMREIYLPAFKAAVTEAHVWSIMTAYNRVNGDYCSENDFLLNQVLKKDWGFQGLVMTDWGGCHSTAKAALAGLDLEMGSNVGGSHAKDYLAKLGEAVGSGEVPPARLDDMVLRNLRVMAVTGLLDADGKRPAAPGLMAPEHIAAARRIAEAACVLLKNEGNVLPIDPAKVKSIAVIGDSAQAKFARDGNSATIKTTYEVTPLEGITKRAGEGIKVAYAQGYVQAAGRGRRGSAAGSSNQALIDDATTAAKSADVAIVVAGLYRSKDQEGADRPSMDLPPGQSELIQAVVAANPRTVVVLNGGSPSRVDPWLEKAAGLVMYWYGGTEGGHALARVLFGDVDATGRLPCTWPRQLADTPAHSTGNFDEYPGAGANGRGGRAMTPESGPQEAYSEGILVGYRWFDAKGIEPQFPFGFGLSYTTLTISGLRLTPPKPDAAPPADPAVVDVNVTVTNTGQREGAAVVQLYISQDRPSVQRPPKELKGFAKISLKPGERGNVSFPVTASALAYYDAGKHAWVVDAGDYTIHVGHSSRDLPLKTALHINTPIVIREGP